MHNLRKLISAIAIASGITGCGFVYDESLTAPYKLIAVDINEQMAVCESLSSNTVQCIIPSTVFAVGWNNSFIIAKQHPFDESRASKPDKTVTNYWILRISDKAVVGPLSEADYHTARTRLGIPSELQFNKIFEDLAEYMGGSKGRST